MPRPRYPTPALQLWLRCQTSKLTLRRMPPLALPPFGLGNGLVLISLSARAAVYFATEAAARIDKRLWDASSIETGQAAAEIINSKLWPASRPHWVSKYWVQLKAELLRLEQDWEVWTDWYEARLNGGFFLENLDVALLKIPNEIWVQGPSIVNSEIKRLIAEDAPPPRRKRDQKPSDLPEIPPPRPAALEPIWSEGKLILPSISLQTDGDSEAVVAALKVLRADIAELADDADGEANIDKRSLAYLRRNAERIPDHSPTQDELFRLAHVKEFLEAYSTVANDEWPNFLAKRFHALTLHFDRTVRQFPKWREFVRNAEKEPFTPEQAVEVPRIRAAFVNALRAPDAQEFIDVEIPDALEKLEQSLTATAHEMNAEKSLVAEDVIESSEQYRQGGGCEPLSTRPEKAKARSEAKTCREKKAAKGINKGTSRKPHPAYVDEAEVSIVKEAKRHRGKGTGPAITRWAKRFAKEDCNRRQRNGGP